MKYFLLILLLVLFFSTMLKQDRKIRKDEYCKEGLFYQMLFKKCTPRNFIYDDDKQEDT